MVKLRVKRAGTAGPAVDKVKEKNSQVLTSAFVASTKKNTIQAAKADLTTHVQPSGTDTHKCRPVSTDASKILKNTKA